MKTSSSTLIAILVLGSLTALTGRAQDMDTFAPVVIKTIPEAGSTTVPPGEYEVKVTFSKEMRDGSWSWSTAWEDSTPETIGAPHYEADHKTCVNKVKLEAGRTYGWWLNSEKFTNFKDKQGHPAVPYLLTFQCATTAPAAGPHINPATGLMETGTEDYSAINATTMAYKASDEVKKLTASGQYDDALQRCLAFHDKYKTGGGTLVPLLSEWVELGRRYPKAREALTDIRDKAAREFAEGRGYSDLFAEASFINSRLQQDDATYELYKSFQDKDPDLARQCYFYVESTLVAKGDYQTYYDQMDGDAQAKFGSINQMLTMQRDNQKRMAEQSQRTAKMIADMNKKNGITNAPLWSPPDTSAMIKRSAENGFVTKVRQLIEVLVGTGHKAEAEKIQDEALQVLDDAWLQSAVADAELTVNGRSEAPQTAGSPTAGAATAKGKKEAARQVCLRNLRQIDAAKHMWALENKKQNVDLPTMADLLPYLRPDQKFPVCPAGGVYEIKAVSEKPTCTVQGHVIPGPKP